MIISQLASGSLALSVAAVIASCFGTDIPGLERTTLLVILTSLTTACSAMLFQKRAQNDAKTTRSIARFLFASFTLLPVAIFGSVKSNFHWGFESVLALNLLALSLILDRMEIHPKHLFSKSAAPGKPMLWVAFTTNFALMVTLVIALSTPSNTWPICSIFAIAYIADSVLASEKYKISKVFSISELNQMMSKYMNWYPEICWTGSAWHSVTTNVPVEGYYKTVERQESVYQGGHPIESFNGYVTRTHFDKVWVPPSTRAVTSRVVTANWEHVFKYGKYTNTSDPEITSIIDNLLAKTPCFVDVKFLWNWRSNSDTEEYQHSKEAFKKQLAEQDVNWEFDESVYAICRDGRQRVSNFRAGVGSDWQQLWMRLGFSFYVLSVALGLGALFRLMWHRHFKSVSINLISAPSI